MTNCQKCGAKLDADDEFCPDCGAKILPAGVALERGAISAQPKKRTFFKVAMIIFGLMLILAACSMYISQSQVAPSSETNPILEPLPPDIDADPSLGPADAKVTIVEYADFECPFCQSVQETLKTLMKEYAGQVRLVFKNYPIGSHGNAIIAAEAGECANEQGKFWEMHDKIFSSSPSLEEKDLKKYAEETGLDIAGFNACFDSGKYREEVGRDIADGGRLSVDGVPAFFINGRSLIGAQPIEGFRKIIDEELSKSR